MVSGIKYKNKMGGNGFFKYHNKSNIDLTRYGIWNETIPSNYDETCLIIALTNGGLSVKKQEIIKRMIKNRLIPLCDIPKICNAAEIQIRVKTEDVVHDGRRIYGKEYNEVYVIGSLIEHYFIIEPTEYTSYSIKNYYELKDVKDFNKIYGETNGKYKRGTDRFIDTFDLIKLMLKDKEQFFTEITLEDIKTITGTIQTSIDCMRNELIDKSEALTLTNISKISKCCDLIDINDETVLPGKTFNTIGDLKESTQLRKVILFITHLKDNSIKEYLDKWIYEEYYSKKRMFGNLTDRIKNINSGICYKQIMRSVFDSYDIKNNVITTEILETKAVNIIKELHAICPSTCGSFIDYLIRRIICELIKKPFDDSRADKMISNNNLISYHTGEDNMWEFIKNDDYGSWTITKEPYLSSEKIGEINEQDRFIVYETNNEWLKIKYKNIDGWVRWQLPKVSNGETKGIDCYDDSRMNIQNKYFQKKTGGDMHICSRGCKYDIIQRKYFQTPEYLNSCSLESCQRLSYEKVKNTDIYHTKDILYDIFLVSLSHTESFGFCPKQETFNIFQDKIKSLNVDNLVLPLKDLCKKLINNKTNILLNPSLGGPLDELENISIPSDADLVLDDILIDIKCTTVDTTEVYYEIFQLLGYAGLLWLNKKYQQKINSVIILNLLEGISKKYDISYLDKGNFIKYIKLLNSSGSHT
jgi:hypothetical protein